MDKTPFVMLQAHPDDYYAQSTKSLDKGEKLVSRVFFSKENIGLLQRRIIREIMKITNGQYLIETQDENDLLTVMKAIYSDNPSDLDLVTNNDIRNYIARLNNIVIADIVPDIISELKTYFRYLDDVFGPQHVLDRPVNVSNAGKKLLPSSTGRFDY